MDHVSPLDHHAFWDRFLSSVEDSINAQSFNTWFRPITLVELTASGVVISVPKPYFASWLEEHYLPLMKTIAASIVGSDLTFSFVSEDGGDNLTVEIAPPDSVEEYPGSAPASKNAVPSFIEQLSINDRFTFDTFVVGNSNQFAFAASKAVAESPGTTAFNPLVMYGGVGLGKTHLLQAIALHCMQSGRFGSNAGRIIYVSSEKFTMDFITSIQNNLVNEYSRYYRSADILLVDDIQFFNNKERTQEEFFHLFNTLHQQGKQIVLTMDNPPNQIKGLADRLINRFQWGLVTDIQPPDFETRVAILNKKAAVDGVYLDPAIAAYIAEHITTNIRELEGSLIRLLAYSSLYGRDLSLDMAQDVLGDTIRRRSSLITIEFIQKLVAEHFNLQLNALIGNSRRKEVANARHIAIYLAKQLTDSSLKTIGLHFGGRDHSTVIHSIQKVEKELLRDPVMSGHIDTLTKSAKNA